LADTWKQEDDLSTARCITLKWIYKEFMHCIWLRNISINIRTDRGVFQTGSGKCVSFGKSGEFSESVIFTYSKINLLHGMISVLQRPMKVASQGTKRFINMFNYH